MVEVLINLVSLKHCSLSFALLQYRNLIIVCTGNCCSEISFDGIPSHLHLIIGLLEWVLNGELLVWQGPSWKTGNKTAMKRRRKWYFHKEKWNASFFHHLFTLKFLSVHISVAPWSVILRICISGKRGLGYGQDIDRQDKEHQLFQEFILKQLMFFSLFKISIVFCGEPF